VPPDIDPAAAGCALLTAVQGGIILSHLRGEAEPLARALDDVINGLIRSAHTQEEA
jgi:hypothetical protein